MSTIPKSRSDLVKMTEANFTKLMEELEKFGPEIGEIECVDGWTVKDLLAVRVWWTQSVVSWVKKGMKGQVPVTPARGYSWKETPRINQDIVNAAKDDSFSNTVKKLKTGYKNLMKLIDSLDDTELLEVGVFEWAGKYPIARWLSLNTARQYATARSLVRKAAKNLL